MSKMLLNLRHVPEDETIEVLQMLSSHDIEHYQVRPSAFMISAGSIWVRNDNDFARAKALFDQLQQQREAQAQDDWRLQKEQGTRPGLLDTLRDNPGGFTASITIAVLIILFMLTPVIQLFR